MPRRNSKDRGRGFNGQVRGGSSAARGSGRGRGRGNKPAYHSMNAVDLPIQLWLENNENGENGSPQGRGRGAGLNNSTRGFATPNRGNTTPRGRGRGQGRADSLPSTPRGRGRGRSQANSKLGPDAPLSRLLHSERPLLKPIVFVRSTFTATLFENEEQILEPVVEDVGDEEKSHVPTADHVSLVFSGIPYANKHGAKESPPSSEDEIEEIDFQDLAQFGMKLDVLASKSTTQATQNAVMVEETFTSVIQAATNSSDIPPPSSARSEKAGRELISRPNASTCTPGGTTNYPTKPLVDQAEILFEEESSFVIDVKPTPPNRIGHVHALQTYTPTSSKPLGDTFEEDEEVIVYVAPYPRSTSTQHPIPSQDPTSGEGAAAAQQPTRTQTPMDVDVPTPSTMVPTGTVPTTNPGDGNPPPASGPSTIPVAPAFESVRFTFADSPYRKQPQRPPVFTAGQRARAKAKASKKEARAVGKKQERSGMFGSFGLMREEAQLRKTARNPRWGERRRDDSDVDWGDDSDEKMSGDEFVGVASAALTGALDKVSTGVGEMDLDPDLNVDLKAMIGFVKGMGGDGGRFVSMDDLADEERMRAEDEEEEQGADRGSSGEDEAESIANSEEELILAQEETILVSEAPDINVGRTAPDEDESSDSSSDEGFSPRSGFQARLDRLRAQARGKGKARMPVYADIANGDSSDDEDEEDDYFASTTRAQDDEDNLGQISEFLEENEDITSGRNRKDKKLLFRAVRDGAFENIGVSPARRKKDKWKDLPEELQEQWEKDRAKKAENKRARAQARMELAADPLSSKKGGKKSQKAMLAAARLDPSISITNRIVDFVSLEQQIRRFVADIGGSSSMPLPPMNPAERKIVHELADVFGLKSLSQGKDEGRFTTLSKTTRTGVGINEEKITKLMKRTRYSASWIPGGKSKEKGKAGAAKEKGKAGGVKKNEKAGGVKEKGKVEMPRPRDGEEVGKAAPKIGASNIGFKMLALMGWAEGDRIGMTGGLDAPLTAVIKNTKLGIGADSR